MNTLEITLLSLNFVLTIAGLEYCIRNFSIRNREVDNSIEALKQRIFELESMLRYDLQFELSELKNKQDDFKNKQDDFKNKQELLEVKISKAQFDFEQVYETLAKSILKTMTINKVEQEGTKPSDSVKNEVVDLIKKEKKSSTTTTNTTTTTTPRTYKKSNVTATDIENAFREKFKMTYYGYREKYGEEALLKAKDSAYQRAYYLKVEKQKLITKK
jgi:hypothetical protein